MATYAIGDVQGCFGSLERLLDRIGFAPSQDRLWFVGDLVNRGDQSLAVLRYVKGLGAAAQVVLGNHDLYLLAAAAAVVSPGPKDTIQEILEASDRDDLLRWLRQRPLLYREPPFVLVHAGLLPQWTVQEAAELAQDAERELRGPDFHRVLRALYPSAHLQWTDKLTGCERLATIIKVLTRLRACSPTGVMESSYTGPPDRVPPGFQPWFEIPGRKHAGATIVCGHWASLGLHCQDDVLALDSGCVWGRHLSAIRLEDRQVFQVPCWDGG
jgi:bis(5'-nucleosyl)-tetraphosphatase (symmetrical)